MQRDLVVRHEDNCVHDVFSVQVSAVASSLAEQKWSEEDMDDFLPVMWISCMVYWIIYVSQNLPAEKYLIRLWFHRN